MATKGDRGERDTLGFRGINRYGLLSIKYRTALVVQWWGLRLPVQGVGLGS